VISATAISGWPRPRWKFTTIDGRVEGVAVVRDGQKIRINTDLVISNIGPKATVALGGEAAFPQAYVEQVRNGLRPAANIVINIASQRPLISHPGIVTFGRTRRLCNMATSPPPAPSSRRQAGISMSPTRCRSRRSVISIRVRRSNWRLPICASNFLTSIRPKSCRSA